MHTHHFAIRSFIFALLLFAVVTGFIGITRAASIPNLAAVYETQLNAPITSSDTTMHLYTNAVNGSGETLQSGYTCFTIDGGKTNAEYVCGTVSGTSVTNMTRGMSFLTGTTTVPALAQAHRRGASVKVTDWPSLGILHAILSGKDTIPSLLTYINTVTFGVGTPTTTVVTKGYVDDQIAAGCSNADDTTKGCVERATAAEAGAGTATGGTGAALVLGANIATSTPTAGCSTFCVVLATAGKIAQGFIDLTGSYAWSGAHTFSSTLTTTGVTRFNATTSAATSTRILDMDVTVSLVASTTITGYGTPQPVYIATSTGAVNLSDANSQFDQQFFGFAVSSATNGQTVYVQVDGIVTGFTGLTKGADYYVQDAVGTIGTSVGTAEVYVGRAISATEIMLVPPKAMQYLGSQALSCNGTITINQQLANYVVANIAANSANGGATHDIQISKVGRTSGSWTDTINVGPAESVSATLTWYTATSSLYLVRGDNATSCSGTAYYYR